MISQTREMTKDVFLSLDDETKVKMHNHQFLVEHSDWRDVFGWLLANTFDPFYIETEHSKTHVSNTRHWVLFYRDEDAAAFKLRWL